MDTAIVGTAHVGENSVGDIMATDFSTVTLAVQKLIDSATTPLSTQIGTLNAQLVTASKQASTDAAKIADLNAQLAVKDEDVFFWFKGTGADVFVYNPIAGTKRHVTAAEWKIIVAVNPTAKPIVLSDADANSIPLA